jgi:Uncharacterized protein conserved in bacteria (DUF2252)
MADVPALTAAYEGWLGSQIPLDAADLARKHDEMARDEYRFLRGTYYLWLVRTAAEIPQAFDHAFVPLVGDLHVENFGTWRDRDQVRRWGVNDLDELARGPWLLDLVRLATSAVLAPHLTLDDHEVSDTVLSAWYDATPGPSVDLGDADASHLGPLVPSFPDPDSFYTALARGPECDDVPPEVVAAAERVAEPGWLPTWHARDAGTGSRGHLRRVGVGRAADDAWHAREAKQLGPPTCAWAAGQQTGVPVPTPDPAAYDLVSTAVRGPAGATRVGDWQVRDLAPDVVRIQLAGQRHKDTRRLVDAMARAAARVHAADPEAFRRARAEHVAGREFREVVATMADAVRRDFHAQH